MSQDQSQAQSPKAGGGTRREKQDDARDGGRKAKVRASLRGSGEEQGHRGNVPAGNKTSRCRPAGTHQGEVQKHESNGHVAEHAERMLSRAWRQDRYSGRDTRGTQRKAARSQQAERIFLSLLEALTPCEIAGDRPCGPGSQFDWGEAGIRATMAYLVDAGRTATSGLLRGT